MARKKATQCNASSAPEAASFHSSRPRAAPSAESGRSSASATAATAERPKTMVTAGSGSHLPNRPANPNNSTATCSAASARVRADTEARKRMLIVRHCAIGPVLRRVTIVPTSGAVMWRLPGRKSMPKDLPAKKVLDAVRNAPGNRVKVAVSDIDGVLRGKYIHKDKFFSAVEGGFGFCDVVFGWDMNDQCYDNTTLTGWHKGFP